MRCEDCDSFVSIFFSTKNKAERPHPLEYEGICFNPKYPLEIVNKDWYCRFWEKRNK